MSKGVYSQPEDVTSSRVHSLELEDPTANLAVDAGGRITRANGWVAVKELNLRYHVGICQVVSFRQPRLTSWFADAGLHDPCRKEPRVDPEETVGLS